MLFRSLTFPESLESKHNLSLAEQPRIKAVLHLLASSMLTQLLFRPLSSYRHSDTAISLCVKPVSVGYANRRTRLMRTTCCILGCGLACCYVAQAGQ